MRPGRQRILRHIWWLACALALVTFRADAQVSLWACAARYRDHILDGPVPNDITELLITAQAARDRFSAQAPELNRYIETKLWLQALGEPQPRRPATVREAINESSLVDLDALRKRGAAKILQLRTLAIWNDTDPVPEFAAPADNEIPGSTPVSEAAASPKEARLYARFRIVNVGHEPVSGLHLQFSVEVSKDCLWRPFDPLREGESTEVMCEFTVPRTLLAAWRSSIETQAMLDGPSNDGSTLHDVSFREEGHNIQYMYYGPLVADPEIVRVAAERLHSACSSDEPASHSEIWDVLMWVVFPGVAGALIGRRFAR